MQNFYLIIIASIIVHLFIFYKAIGITYFTRSLKETNGKLALTDNEKILFNAKKYKIFAWPSSMHDMPFNRAQLREFWFLAVSIISKIFMKSNDIIIVSLSLLSNFISIIFIFLIFNHLFNQETAFIVTLFYLTSLWPYQISFYVGHILFSQVWFLFSIFILTLHQIYDLQFISFFLAGAFLVLCFASSSSSRKFPPLIIALFFFINIENIFVFNFEYFLDRIENIFIFFLISFTIIYLLNQIVNKKLNFYINSKNYSKKKKKKIKKIKKKLAIISIITFYTFTFFLFSLGNNIFFFNLLSFLIGISFVAFILLTPNYIENSARYLAWLNEDINLGNHFRAWPSNYFGINTSGNFIAPIKWLPKFFLRLIPAIFLLYTLSIFLILFVIDFNWLHKLIIIFLSLIPLIIMELSKATRLARSHFPTLVSFLFLIGFVHHNLDPNIYFDIFFYSILFIQVVHSLYFFFKDILPTRMCSSNLKKKLEERNISEFTTYNNTFNNANVFPMMVEHPDKFKIFYSENIIKSNTKYFIVPGISSKSVSFECDANVIKSGDFKSDETLNYLIKNKLIEKCSVIKLPTFGCSKFFVLESEVTSFRSLIIKDIHQKDLDLGYLYVLDCDLVRKYIK